MIEQQFLDALHTFCPCLPTCQSYEESVRAISDLTNKLLDDYKMKNVSFYFIGFLYSLLSILQRYITKIIVS